MSRPEYGSDLHLWPVKPEVSPLREEDADMPGQFPESWPESSLNAVARSTDPGTSWEAARSITPEKLSLDQQAVLDVLRRRGPMTDERIRRHVIGISDSGCRTRRSELVAAGLVRDSGRKDTLRSGRRAIVWEAVERE